MNKFQIKIPKIIHQIWSGIDEPLPNIFRILGDTWKHDYPDWEYRVWNDQMMNDFIQQYYPQYWEIYQKFPYNIQRWDAIRYLILDKMGGMYVDFDYESINSIEPLIEGKTCCFSEEPVTHKANFEIEMEHYFNNGMMLSIPNHPFMRKIITSVFSNTIEEYNPHCLDYVLRTTGPWKIMKLYANLTEEEKREIYLIPQKYVTPFDFNQARRAIVENEESEELENCLQEAYAVHYFFSEWRKQIK